ncbi:hypothetical protein [Paludisphaera mucosa]|uniref:Uncharacterized protein n=1 Tax=Paludisphaera mucosa TaxID=3030827 RepID=A0ABT6FHA5_9BACT|nr:hypothetical protein [Paludisphaera mucosa]MDG3006866.1 hypothetical protein [Paludisphaera mucosa]
MVDPIDEAAPAALEPSRRFGLGDVMILVAAAGFGLAIARIPLSARGSMLSWRPGAGPWGGRAIHLLMRLSAVIGPVVAALTVAAVVVRLRHPRPRLRRLVRQPGLVACVAATIALAMTLVQITPTTIMAIGSGTLPAWMYDLRVFVARSCGYSVVGAWLALSFSGRWRSERGWIDRFGRTMGVAWLVAVAMDLVTPWIEYLRW